VAHLFEHLMFMGTDRVPEGKIDRIMEGAGGWNNAYTSQDQTVYYDVGPARMLQTLLWIEADRMATLAGALTDKKLNLQRDVVVNEYRQSYENAPYGKAWLTLPGLVWGEQHPYGRPVIGSLDHLRQVKVADLQRLFARYYSPRNASLVVAGKFDLARTRGLVEKYFGWIPSGPAPRRARAPEELPPAKAAAVRRTIKDRVKLPRLYMVWRSPTHMAPGDAEMDLAAEVLCEGKESRLYKALVYEQRVALDVTAYQESRALGSQFVVRATAMEGITLDALEKAVARVLADFRAAPPSEQELARARNNFEVQFMHRLERLRNRAELLNTYFDRTGQPDHVEQDLDRYRAVTRQGLHDRVKPTLAPSKAVILRVVPSGK
jgi:zinc protease